MSDPLRDNIIFWTGYLGGIVVGLVLGRIWRAYRDWSKR